MKKLIIVGAGEFAQIAYEYFTYDSTYDVVAFSVHRKYLPEISLLNDLPILAIEDLADFYNKNEVELFVAIPASKMNTARESVYLELKGLGYLFASYVSSAAFIWRNAKIGENCFIFENNVIQPFVAIGNNCVLWSGNHIGHRSRIEDNVFITSHVVVSGYCVIGSNSFLGVNSTIIDNIEVARLNLIGAGSLIHKNTNENSIYIGNPARPVPGKLATESDI
jgi:sugar O-acyltransferase (sialic acid O-acetyltransferase NeuD family)